MSCVCQLRTGHSDQALVGGLDFTILSEKSVLGLRLPTYCLLSYYWLHFSGDEMELQNKSPFSSLTLIGIAR
jgi:hypothetical protein